MDTRFKNTDFFIEDIDESVKDLTVNDSSVSHFPANTDFFIENIDNNVTEICTDRGITPSTVSVVPANTDFFIVNIDTNVKKIATDLSITPSSVSKSPANTDFFIENIYFNVILICEELNITPSEITVTPANTDFFIETIAKNVELIMEAQTEIHVSGTFIHAVLSADSKISDYELDGNATQDGTPTPDAPVPINTVTGEQVVKVVGKNLFDINTLNKGSITVTDGVASGTALQFHQAFGADGIGANIPSGQISITATAYTDGNSSTAQTVGLRIRAVYTDGTGGSLMSWDNDTLQATEKTATTASGKNVDYIAITYQNSGSNIWHLSNIQIELGSTASDYQAFQSQTKTIDLDTIELAKIDTYQDRIYKDEGKWYIEKQVGEVVLDGTEADIAMYATNKFRVPVADMILQASGASEPPVTMSDYFVGSNYTAVSAGSADNIMSGYYNAHQLRIHSTKWSSTADFTTWLGTHNTTVYYALSTPTTTEITDETLLSQLNAIYDIELKEGVINISVTATSPNLPASLKVTIIPTE